MKKILSVFLSIVMLYCAVGSAIYAQAATTRFENYWSSDGKSYKLITVNGEDAFCIDFGGTASGSFQSSAGAQNYYANVLSHSDRVAIDKIISYANKRGYLNCRGDSNTRYAYYSGIQRAIWQITNPYASNNSLSSWYKKQTQSVYNDIMNNYQSQISSDDMPSVNECTLTEKDGYSSSVYCKNLDNWKIVSASSGISASVSNDVLNFSSSYGYFDGVKKINFRLKNYIYSFNKYYAGVCGEQYVIMTAGGENYFPFSISVDADKNDIISSSKTGTISINNVDADSKKSIQYSTFEITYKNGNGEVEKQTAQTDKNGIVTFTELPVYTDGGENAKSKTVFTVTEISPDSNYLYMSDQKSVTDITLNENEHKMVSLPGYDNWPNMIKLGDFEVRKSCDAYPNYISAPNVEFAMTAENGTTYTTKTDENGEAYFCNLPVGKYTLSETPDSKYVTPESKEFYIDWDGNTSTENRAYSNDALQFTKIETESYGDNNDTPNYDVLIPDQNTNNSNSKEYQYDESINCSLRVVLTDDDDNPIPNANFLLMNANYVVYGTITTNEEGIAEYDNLPAGRYIIKQQTTADGYVIRTVDKIVTFSADEANIDATITNDKGKSAIGSDEKVTTGRVVTNIVTFFETMAHIHSVCVDEEGVKPTCSKTGLTAISHCSDCGAVIDSNHKVIPKNPNNHSGIVVDKSVSPTCEQSGHTEGVYCADCNKTLFESRILPAKGHKWNEGVKRPDGSILYTCTVCSYKKIDRSEQTHTCVWSDWKYNGDAVYNSSNDYKNGTKSRRCTICGYVQTVEAPNTALLRKRGDALALESNITLATYVGKDVVDYYDEVYAEFTRNGKTTKVYPSEKTLSANSTEYNIFDYKGISPQALGDEISITVYGIKDGITYWGNTVTYSITDYIKKILSDDKADMNFFSTVLVDLVYYGEACQMYQGYNTDKPLTDILTDRQKTFRSTGDLTLTNIKNSSYATCDNRLVKLGTALRLSDSVELAIPLNMTDVTVNDLTMKVKVGNRTLSYSYAENPECFELGKDGYWYFYFNGLYANQLSDEVFITAYRGEEQVSYTLRYSAESYAATVKDEKLKAVTDAMMRYGNSAKAYKQGYKAWR